MAFGSEDGCFFIDLRDVTPYLVMDMIRFLMNYLIIVFGTSLGPIN